jgi:inner membrane protease ATP23
MKNLTASLKAVGSKTQTLFSFMGVNVTDSTFQNNRNTVTVQLRQRSLSQSLNETFKQTESRGFGGRTIDNVSQVNPDTIQETDTMFAKLKRTFTKQFQSASMTDRRQITVATSASSSSLDDSNPPLSLEISCQPCGNSGPEGGARAFVKGPDPLSIVLCSNRLFSREDIEQVLVHELIHVFDVHIRKWDLTNCYTLAKSEIRAAREAECANSSMSFTKRYCSKEKARVATKNMFPDEGLQCVAAVFEEAIDDYAPFDMQEEAKDENNSYSINTGNGTIFGRTFQSSYDGDSRK